VSVEHECLPRVPLRPPACAVCPHMAPACPLCAPASRGRCSGFGAEGLGHLGSGCPDLQVLNLSYCQEGCSDATLASFCSSARALRNLEMRGCRGVTALGLAAMASGCKSLQELDLRGAKGLMMWGSLPYSQGCQYLRQVRPTPHSSLLSSHSSLLSCAALSLLTTPHSLLSFSSHCACQQTIVLKVHAHVLHLSHGIAHGTECRVPL